MCRWYDWYDDGMKTPLPPLIQYELHYRIGEQPDYYDHYDRPLYMDLKELEDLPLFEESPLASDQRGKLVVQETTEENGRMGR